MSNVINILRQKGFSELACQFAQYIERVDNTGDLLVPLTAGLLTEAMSQGHVCLNLTRIDTLSMSLNHWLPTELEQWQHRLMQSNTVGRDNDYKPLIIDEHGALYLYRYWQNERLVAQTIHQRCLTLSNVDKAQLTQDMSSWEAYVGGIDWQKVAVIMALTRQFCVISGGPGTGKTTIILRILQCLRQQNDTYRIALAAPTGKATARIQQVINQQQGHDVQAKTLHRLLGITPDNDAGRYNSQQPLPFDVIIIDEASMIDISLMAKILRAISMSAQLILLGDSHQLASVESGAVLANLCQHGMQFSDEFSTMVSNLVGMDIGGHQKKTRHPMTDNVVLLEHSFRFEKDSVIGRLANAVQTGDAPRFITELNQQQPSRWYSEVTDVNLEVINGFHSYFEAVMSGETAVKCLQLFDCFRVLCATKQGPESVASVNMMMERHLATCVGRGHNNSYHGRPIMITQNDYRQRLFNGDTGLILNDADGQLRACFLIDNVLRWIDLIRLPTHETAFAITIHKSQGSEFDHVCVVLPQQETALLTRELLYTAITRAKKRVTLVASEMILRNTVTRQHQRESGLAQLLQTMVVK